MEIFQFFIIYDNYNIVDIFYEQSKQSLTNNHYYFTESNVDNIKKLLIMIINTRDLHLYCV